MTRKPGGFRRAAKASRTGKIDYFATSLPNMLLFEDDLQQRNRVESLLLSGLAAYGLGNQEQHEAAEHMRNAHGRSQPSRLRFEMLR